MLATVWTFFQNDRRRKVTARRIVSVVLIGTMVLGSLPVMAQTAANADDQALDKLIGPIALYPDPLLAQVLACASSPEQVTEVSAWLKMQDKGLQGSKLQEAATAKGFDASFAAIVLFPDVLDTLAQNLPWTTEVGKAFVSDQKAVLASVQRLRKQAQSVGNLKTTPQQEVKVDTQDGQQVIVVQPANPQIVYVPVYNTEVVYTTPPPPPEKDNSDAVAAAALGFMAGIVMGAAVSDPYPYGWGAWGVGWHSHAVVVTGAAWRVPPGGRYGYARPVPYGRYRAPTNINAPSRNVNINNSTNVNINNSRNQGATARPSTQTAARSATAQNRPAGSATPSTRGYSSPSASSSAARTGTSSSGLSGYQNNSSARSASSRGQRSAGGGGRR